MGDGGALGGEGPVTVLFTDVEGSTDLRGRLGDEAAQEALRAHDVVVRAAVAECGGREVKALGDGFMVAFVSPRRALACAQAVQRAIAAAARARPDQAVRVRIGMNTGEVVEEDGDLFGQAVHAAARIAAKARGGEILVSDVTRALAGTGPELVFADRGRFRLKGFEDRWRLFELAWATADDTGPAAGTTAVATGVDRTPFVGRAPQRALLAAAVERAAAGAGGIVLVGGEPGIGKTRLAEEAAAGAVGAGMAVLAGHSYEMAGASPYVAFVEILEAALAGAASPEVFRAEVLGDAAPEVARLVPQLRRLFPDLAAPLDLPPAQERQYLFRCLSDVFTRLAATRPTVVLLDDLQWADEPTLLFVEHLAPNLARLPLLVVATYRDVEVGRPLARTFEDLHRRRLAQRIKLGALAPDESAGVIRALAGQEPPAGLVEALHGATEGNVFFLEEVFRDLVEQARLFDTAGRFRSDIDVTALGVPEGVRLVIGRRVERLTPQAQRLLAAAAVAGRVFSFRLLQALGDLDPDAVLDVVDEAEQAMLIAPGSGDDEFLFAHELIRQTLAAGLSAPRRRRAHLRAAEATIATRAGHLDEHAAEIAHHLTEAGEMADPKQVLTYSLMAGKRALATSAFTEAAMHLERAETLEARALPLQRAELFVALGTTHFSLGRVDEAIVAWRRAISEYEAQGDGETVGRVCADVGFNLVYAARMTDAVEMLQRGLESLGGRISAHRARLLGQLGMMTLYAGDAPAADDMFTEALRLADELNDETDGAGRPARGRLLRLPRRHAGQGGGDRGAGGGGTDASDGRPVARRRRPLGCRLGSRRPRPPRRVGRGHRRAHTAGRTPRAHARGHLRPAGRGTAGFFRFR